MRPEIKDVVAVLLILQFGLALLALFTLDVPPGNKEQVIFMLGQSAGMASLAAGFYFASSKGDDKAKENTGKAFDAIKAAQEAPASVTLNPGPDPVKVDLVEPKP